MRSVSVPFIWLTQCKSSPPTDQLESLKESYRLISERLPKLLNLGTAAAAEEAGKTYSQHSKAEANKMLLNSIHSSDSHRKCNKGCSDKSSKTHYSHFFPSHLTRFHGSRYYESLLCVHCLSSQHVGIRAKAFLYILFLWLAVFTLWVVLHSLSL